MGGGGGVGGSRLTSNTASKGGGHEAEQIKATCKRNNGNKGKHDSYTRKLGVHQGDAPAA